MPKPKFNKGDRPGHTWTPIVEANPAANRRQKLFHYFLRTVCATMLVDVSESCKEEQAQILI